MWAETRSALRQIHWRGQVSGEEVLEARERFHRASIEMRSPAELGDEAWRIAEEFGWAKTYDAEYIALARLLGCRFVTLDARLKRRTARLGFVVGPTEL